MTPSLRAILLSPPFTPAKLFRAGEKGVWYDPSDFTTLFQDSAGTTPVTATGQPVGKILDKSGNGNHATQATAGARPLLQQDSGGRYYLNFDGIASGLATASIDFTSTDKMTVLLGLRKSSDSTGQVILELGVNSGTTNGFGIIQPGAIGKYAANLFGATLASLSVGAYNAPITNVVSTTFDIAAAAGSEMATRVDGRTPPTLTPTGDAGSANFPSAALNIGKRSGSAALFTGFIYGLIVRGASTSATDIARGERWMAPRAGVSL